LIKSLILGDKFKLEDIKPTTSVETFEKYFNINERHCFLAAVEFSEESINDDQHTQKVYSCSLSNIKYLFFQWWNWANIFVFVYSVIDKASLELVQDLHERVTKLRKGVQFQTILIGTKGIPFFLSLFSLLIVF
jgi:hypothetical protein